MRFKIEGFGGMIPAIDDRLLPPTAAAECINTHILSGRIEPVHAVVALHPMMSPTAQSWFRLPRGAPGIDSMVDSDWLEFDNPNVRVIASPIAGQDDGGRYYWADGSQPMYNTADRIHAGQPPFKLGIPAPPVAPGVDPDGGAVTEMTTRTYVYTWVSADGQEGPPSPPTTADGDITDTWQLTFTPPDSTATDQRDLTYTRIYRTITSTQGVATFYFVAEIDIFQTAYNDGAPDSEIAFNDQLETLYWTEPPIDLQGLVTMPNGMIAGWRTNEVWFCEPYHPHAWPVQYMIAVETKIVGLGVYNQSVIILTEGQPYAATGIDPSSMALAIIQPLEACTSRKSIVSTPNGVLYSSPNGLINITPAGAMNLTKDIMLKDQWADLLDIDQIAAGVIMGGYYAYSAVIATAISAATRTPGYNTGAFISLNDLRVGVTQLVPAPAIVGNVITDLFNGELMVLRNRTVYVLDVRQQTPYNEYLWRSKIFTMDYIDNMGAAKVYYTPALDDPDVPGPPTLTVFRFYAGTKADAANSGLPLRYSRVLKPSGEMFRLPTGYKALYMQVEVEGNALIDAIHVASSARELRAI